MVIAVDARSWNRKEKKESTEFVTKLFLNLCQKHTGHRFYFLSDGEINLDRTANSRSLIISPAAKNFLLREYWVKIKLPAALKTLKATVLVSDDAKLLANKNIAQCFLAEHLPLPNKQKLLNNAASIAYLSGPPNDIEAVDKNRLFRIPPAPDTVFNPIGWEDKDAIKEKYTSNKEYFMQAGWINPNQTIDLLKAFSFFKRRQQSGMKLVLTQVQTNAGLSKQLNTFKYRNDVVLVEDISETVLARLASAAYAMIYPGTGFNTMFLNGMQAGVPVLLSTQSSIKSAAGDAALYFQKEVSDLAEQMMLIYKDENLRSRLIEQGKERIAGYTWQYTTDALWLAIENAAANKKVTA